MPSLFDLNPQQLDAVRTVSGPVLILAGAGTGKTRVITMRIVYLLSEGIPPNHILAVTFTNRAAREMRDRVAAMVNPAEANRLTICTFHSLCVRILRQDIDRLGYKSNFTIYDESDQIGLIKKVIARVSSKDEKLDHNQARNLISRAKSRHWKIKPAADEESLIAAVYHRYQEELKVANAVDFDDLLTLAVRLLAEYPDVRQKWRDRFQFIMVDEFQDTNTLQLELVNLLGGEHRNVCVVGDDDQSIYSWRGAEIANILEFEHHFPDPKIVKLEQNYRSTNSILGAANSIIRHNPRRRPKSLWSEHGEGEKVKLVEVPDDREEANYVVSELQKAQHLNGTSWGNFAVIFRMNAQSRVFEEQLRRLQIPYRIVGGRSFFERREVKDVLGYLSCCLNPADDLNLLRIINTPARGIGANTIELAVAESNRAEQSVFETLQSTTFHDMLSTRTRTAVQNFVELIDRFETRFHEPLVDLPGTTQALLTEIGFAEELRRSCKTPEEALTREENVRELVRTLGNFQARSTDGLAGFLAEMSLDQERQEEDEKTDREGVTLITFHAAKGLEFPHVFLVGVEEGILPHDRSKLEGTLDEERRLLYVGMTRARQTLTISYCASRLRYGSASPCQPSSFLTNLDETRIERIDFQALTNAPASEGTARSHFAKMRELLGS